MLCNSVVLRLLVSVICGRVNQYGKFVEENRENKNVKKYNTRLTDDIETNIQR